MEQEIRIPKNAVVIITGPCCAGKSTLAKRMIETMPIQSRALVSIDEIVQRLMAADQAQLFGRATTLQEGGFRITNELYNRRIQREITDALLGSSLTVIDTCLLDPMAIIGNCGYCGVLRPDDPVILLLLCPEPALLTEFYQRRAPETRPLPVMRERQVEMFQKVLEFDFDRHLFDADRYVVKDPRAVKFTWI